MICLSSNHFCLDQQMSDAVDSLDEPIRANLLASFPELDHLVWQPPLCSLDTEAMGVGDEWVNWVVDWLESHTDITWWEGEPVIFEEGDEIEKKFFAGDNQPWGEAAQWMTRNLRFHE